LKFVSRLASRRRWRQCLDPLFVTTKPSLIRESLWTRVRITTVSRNGAGPHTCYGET
jgi:hypothetical protein